MPPMTQKINHQQQRNSFTSKVARVWANRSYAFRSTTYGVAGGTALLACAALETCLPLAGSFIFNSIVMPVLAAAPFAATAIDAATQYRKMSKLRGVSKSDAAKITFEAFSKIGLIHAALGFLAVGTPLVIQQNHLANANYPDVRDFVDIAIISTTYVVGPVMAWMLRQKTKDDVRVQYNISTLTVEDQHGPHDPASSFKRIINAKTKPFTI